MKVHKIETYIFDFEDYGSKEYVDNLENLRNYIRVGKVVTFDIGEWHDNHPLNLKSNDPEEYFKKMVSE